MRPGEVARSSGAPRSTRPIAAESETAQALIEAMGVLGLLHSKARRLSPNVIALALAMRRNDATLHGLDDDDCNDSWYKISSQHIIYTQCFIWECGWQCSSLGASARHACACIERV
jgi:hypothetical protein